MSWSLMRRRTVWIALGLLVAAGSFGVAYKLRRDLRGALSGAAGSSVPLTYAPLSGTEPMAEHWGGGEVEAVAFEGEGLLTAGAFGVRDSQGEISKGLPTLRASALTSWRGHGVAALASGGLFLRRNGAWEELRHGFGILHVRALLETPGGELWIGAREGLFRAAWGANRILRLDGRPVKSLARTREGAVIAGGEEGLRKVEASRVTAVETPDPWIEWVGVEDRDLLVLTPQGLARGPLGAPLVPVSAAEGAHSAALAAGAVFVLLEGRLLRLEASGRAREEFLPGRPLRLMETQGQVFADTAEGLCLRGREGWRLVRPRAPHALPPGPSHVNALGRTGSQVAVGLFSGGVVLGDGRGSWSSLPGSEAWGVNALLNAGGSLYVASLRGAARFDGRRLVPLDAVDQGAAFSAAPVPGGVAVGYGQGVALPGGRFLSAFHGLPGNQALALAGKDQLFVGTPTGLGAIAGSKVLWRVVAGEGKLPHPWVTALAPRKDELFIGTYGGGVARRVADPQKPGTPGRFDGFVETEGLKVNPGCLLEAGGRLWMGTDGRGLWRLDEARGRFVRVRTHLPSPRVTALLEDGDALYVGTDEGLARIPLSTSDEG